MLEGGIEKWTGKHFTKIYESTWMCSDCFFYFLCCFLLLPATSSISYFHCHCVYKGRKIYENLYFHYDIEMQICCQKSQRTGKMMLCVQEVQQRRRNFSNVVGHESPSDIFQYHACISEGEYRNFLWSFSHLREFSFLMKNDEIRGSRVTRKMCKRNR